MQGKFLGISRKTGLCFSLLFVMELLLKNLKEDVTCSICLDTHTKSKTISCLHTFCSEYQERHPLTSQKTRVRGFYRWSKRQAQARIPEGKRFDDLPGSFLHNSFLSLLPVRRSGEGNKISCSTSQKKSAEINYCFDCEKFMRWDCAKALFQGHKVTPVRQFQATDHENLLNDSHFAPLSTMWKK